MRPVLYTKDETKFVDFGLGEISDAIKIEVTRERNGDYSLYMSYPHDGMFAQTFEKQMQIKADAGARTKWQTFDIVRINKKNNDFIEIYAKHMSYRLDGLSLKPTVSGSGMNALSALNLWKNNLIGGETFDVDSDIETISSITWEVDTIENARNALGGATGSMLDVYGGEFEFDNNIVKLHKQMGRQAPVVLEYGRNIQEIEADDDDSDQYNSIFPYAKSTVQDSDNTSRDVLTTLPEFYIDGPFIGNYQRRIIKRVDFSSKFDSEKNKPTEDKLRDLAKKYVLSNSVGKPSISIDVKFVDLSATLDYADIEILEEVELCDILPLYYPKFGITSDSEKVVKTIYDVINEEYSSITLGTIGESISSTLSGNTSARLDALESNQRDIKNILPSYLINANGNNVWYETPDDTKEHKIGDMWYQKNGEYYIMSIWNGSQWEEVLNTENMDGVSDQLAEINTKITGYDESITKANEALTEFEKLKKDINDNKDKTDAVYNIVGNNGQWTYSKNRLHIDGQNDDDITSNEITVTLEERQKVFSHNGEGFSIGNDYTFSYANATFVERPNSKLTINFKEV